MSFFHWDESFSVNVSSIDEQHKKLFGMLNAFYTAQKESNEIAFHTLLDSLVDYAQYHFRTEEAYFDRFRYPDSEDHKKAHSVFINKIMDVRARIRKGEFVISLEVTNFLKNWLLEHIKNTDKKYSKCFNDSGLF